MTNIAIKLIEGPMEKFTVCNALEALSVWWDKEINNDKKWISFVTMDNEVVCLPKDKIIGVILSKG